jgi:hypothetical protein
VTKAGGSLFQDSQLDDRLSDPGAQFSMIIFHNKALLAELRFQAQNKDRAKVSITMRPVSRCIMMGQFTSNCPTGRRISKSARVDIITTQI